MEKSKLSPGQKAKNTGIWAKTMTKWLISYSSKGRKKWHFVSFEGKNGGESTGIVDFIAIRRNHKVEENALKIGDYFELILIQVKGGSASMPTEAEKIRLAKVGEHYHAKKIILSSWIKGKRLVLYYLENNEWIELEPKEVFR